MVDTMSSEACCPPKRRRLVEMRADGVCNVLSPVAGLEPPCMTSASPSHLTGPVTRVKISKDSEKCSQQMSSLEMEGEMVSQALDNVVNLPDAVHEVVLLNRDHNTEIERQQLMLNTLKKKLQEAQKKYDRALQDIAHITRQIYLTQDQVLEKKRQCEAHETKLNGLLSKVEDTKVVLEREEEERKTTFEKLQAYRNKMEDHKKRTSEYEGEFPVPKKLRETRARVQELKTLSEGIESNKVEAERITSGKMALESKQQHQTLEEQCQKVMDRMAQRKVDIGEQIDKQTQIAQSIEVLHKRNAAQLTRLKRQLKEAQSHNRQWQDQAVQLHQTVTEARRHLEE